MANKGRLARRVDELEHEIANLKRFTKYLYQIMQVRPPIELDVETAGGLDVLDFSNFGKKMKASTQKGAVGFSPTGLGIDNSTDKFKITKGP